MRFTPILLLAFACGFGSSLRGAETYTWYATQKLDGYTLYNNAWGFDALHITGGGTYEKTFWGSNSTADWGAEWNSGSSYANNVKGYPALICGWQFTVPQADYRLPRAMSSLPAITVNWWTANDWSNNSRYDQSLDLFAADVAYPGNQNPKAELMVWYNWGNVQPAGSQQGTVSLGGETWEKWVGNVGWPVVTYRKVNQTWGRNGLPLTDFIRNANEFKSHPYLITIEAGWECFTGSARWHTTYFNMTGL